MATMMEILKAVYPLANAPVSAGTDAASEIYKRELPFTVHEYPTGSEYNGWVLPEDWEVLKAEIRKDGKVIYDGCAHPLGVWGYSQSFQGTVGLEELKAHLAYSGHWEEALVYYGDLYYKLGRKDWGFSVPQSLFRSLSEGEYEIDLRTRHRPGTLKVLDYVLPGRSPRTIVFNAHNCHAAQANDDTSGCVVGIEIMRRLAKRDNLFTYRLVICPELYGTLFWLKEMGMAERRNQAYSVMLKSVGNRQALSLQKSFTGDTPLDKAAIHYFRLRHPDGRIGDFRTIYGNDETVFEAPGFEIPSISMTRYPSEKKGQGRYPVPYPEYHTSMDDHRQILEAKLEEAVESAIGIADILEGDCAMRRKFEGLLCLSNPKYDLYQRTWDPANLKGPGHGETDDWHYLMNCVMRYFDGKTTVLEIAERHNLPFDAVMAYLKRFREKGLIEFIPGGTP